MQGSETAGATEARALKLMRILGDCGCAGVEARLYVDTSVFSVETKVSPGPRPQLSLLGL
ncbi:hypothetical protein [Hyperthermus butylicus]|uniref:hypothetical protein n=1 Tax=Hyperthermus butylicus TaxID=54248 RepID=UPI00064FB3FB|nr:hypothetical protein [Hyperthermus butylicus]